MTYETTDVTIEFGSLCLSIRKQLLDQGFEVSDRDGNKLQHIADAINLLKVHNILSEVEVDKSQQKTFDMIFKLKSFKELP